MRRIRCLWVGKLREPWWRDAAGEYLGRVRKFFPLDEVCLPDALGVADAARRKEQEGARILAALEPRDHAILLDEGGKAHTSRQLADRLRAMLDDPVRRPCFVIGGSHGVADGVKAACASSLSLGPLTLPHELARALFLEQLYRACTIIHGLPYHHD